MFCDRNIPRPKRPMTETAETETTETETARPKSPVPGELCSLCTCWTVCSKLETVLVIPT